MSALFQRKAGITSLDSFDLLSENNSIYGRGDNLGRINTYKSLVNSAIKTQLNENQRKTLQLYYFDKLTVYQIAKEMNISASAVSKRLKVSKRKIHNFAVTCIDSGVFKNV